MPTKREREYYRMGFTDGVRVGRGGDVQYGMASPMQELRIEDTIRADIYQPKRKPKRKLSAWNKYVKNKRNHITYRDGKLNLKKMAVAFRRTKRR